MKRILLLVTAMLAMANMIAQDVYVSIEKSNVLGIVKNGTTVYQVPKIGDFNKALSVIVDPNTQDAYWIHNLSDHDNGIFSKVIKNNTEYFQPEYSGDISDLVYSDLGLLSAGSFKSGNLWQACIWRNDEVYPFYNLGDGEHTSWAYSICVAPGGGIYTCGYMGGYGVVWKDALSEPIIAIEDANILDVAYYDGSVYSLVQFSLDDDSFMVYEDDSPLYLLSEERCDFLYCLPKIKIDAGNIYVCATAYYDFYSTIWKNGQVMFQFDNSDKIAMDVTADGVFYCVYNEDVQRDCVYKDGELLFQLPSSNTVFDLFVDESCTDDTPRALPYSENFDMRATDWNCWTKTDEGENGDANYSYSYASYWHRMMYDESNLDNNCAFHRYNGDHNQEGWLISPRLAIPNGGEVTLSFKTYEQYPGDLEYEGVLVSTTGTAPSDFVEIWTQNNASQEWKVETIDLTQFVGQNIYIAFKYAGENGHSWSIDDVNVEQEAAAQYTITTGVNPANAGMVEGGGTYPAGEMVYLTASANPGWTFSHWSDGITANPRSITVTGDATYTANFLQESYNLIVNASPAEGGTVTGGGSYHYGDVVTLTATANEGYTFVSWSDGDTNSSRTVTVTENATYTAYFTSSGGSMFTVTVVSDNPFLGSVSGSGTYPAGAVIQISAIPGNHGRFVSWDDGNTDNPRTVTVTSDLTFKAKFVALQSYTITVESSDPTMGTATGGGTFIEGSEITISATAFSGYYFTSWDDGNADNPRTITVTQNATYKAEFSTNAVQTYTLTVMCNSDQGTVIGSGSYAEGAVVTIAAIPNSGYEFEKWNDDNTQNPRQVTVNDNMVFVAFFKGTGVDENEGNLMVLYPNPANDYIRIEGLEANSEVRIYDMMGNLVKLLNADGNEEIGINDLSAGLYLLRCGNATIRFVKTN